jgi:GT2 family glycosyltransferase
VPPALSVVIPSHNRPDLLRRCLASVFRRAPPETEVVVVDDGSPEGCVTAAAAEFPEVRVLRRQRPGGFCAAANAGLYAARHPVVELLNDDTEVTAGWADAALAHFAAPDVGAVAPLVLLREKVPSGVPRVDSAGDRYFLGGVAGKRGHGQPLGPEHLQSGEVFGASGSSAFYARAAVLDAGGFAENFGAYFEDVDLSFRLHWAGFRIVYEPHSRLWHDGGASHGPPRRRLLEQQSCNEERVFWRNLPAGMMGRALPWHLLVLAAKACKRWQEGQLMPWLLGRLRAVGEFGPLLRHRRSAHSACPCPDTDAWGVEARLWR